MFKNLDFSKYDIQLFAAVCVMVIFGAVMVISSSAIMADVRMDSPYFFVKRQAIWVICGFIAMLATSFFIDYRLYKKYAPLIFLAAFIAVVLVLFIGGVRGGARRWFIIGPFQFQPSEFAKIALVIMTARYIEKKSRYIEQFKAVIPPVILFFMLALPVALGPDLGTPALMFMVLITMLFIAGIKLRVLSGIFLGALFVAVIEVVRKPYRLARVKDYFASFIDLDASSYQVKQALYAFGSGGVFGKGLGKGEMKLLYLPEAHTDFIFPMIGEELGFILGVLAVISFFVYFMYRGLKISDRADDKFGEMLALGITLTIVFQAFLNMGVATGVLPAKGLPLPFVSYGGSALVFTMASVGILINISKGQIRDRRTGTDRRKNFGVHYGGDRRKKGIL